jgi:hypothetical protein
MKFGRKDFQLAFKTGTDANKAKFKKECVQGEIYHATDTGFFYVAEVTAGANDATLSKFGVTPFNQYSVSFDGTDDYCDCGDLTAINSIANCSYSFWYKQVNSGLSVLMGNINNKVGAYHWSDGNAYFRIANRAHTIVGSPTLNQWHHVVVTFDGSVTTSKLYLDGVYKSIVTNEASTTNFQAGIRFYIGRGFATGYGSPLVDEFSIFTTTLSDGGGLSTGDTAGGDIASIYNSGVPNNLGTDGLNLSPLHWWRMGENDGGSGATITDQGNGGKNGTLNNIASPNGFVTDVP